MTVSSTETHYQQICILYAALHLNIRHWNFSNLLGTQTAHQIMVFRLGRNSTCITVFFQASQNMHITFLSRQCPITDTCFSITLVRSIIILHFRSNIGWVNSRIVCQIRQFPCAGTICYKTISQQHHRSHVFQGNLTSIISSIKTMSWRSCGNDRHRRFTVTAKQSLQ